MGLFEQFPYTNFQEKNLDSIAGKLGDLDRSVKSSEADAEAAAQSAKEAASTQQTVSDYMERAEAAAGSAETSAAAAGRFLEDLQAEVTPAVEDWLTEHITQPTTPVVDDTLSISGAAADAAVTGAKFSNLDRTLTEPQLTWERKYISTTGVISDNSYQALSNIIPVHPGDMFINQTPSTDSANVTFVMFVCTYIGDTFQAKIGISSAATRTQIIPEGITGIRFQFGRLSNTGVTWQNSDISYWNIKYYIKPASYQELMDSLDPLSQQATPRMFCYSDFNEESGFWNTDGSMSSNFTHTQKLRIIPGGRCYVANTVNQSSQGAWFDQFGNWIAPLLQSEISEYQYPTPSKGTGTYTYVTLYQFVAPSNAFYLSLNLRTSNQYKSYVASVPVFIHKDTGNICLYDDASLARFKNRKLCVIGASTAMISRFFASAINQSICGWQEYVAAFYDSMETFGYSGGSIGAGYTEYTSIWQGIVGNAVDLSGFDDFIILATKNGMTVTGIGSWGTLTDPPFEHDSYMGGLRSIVEYIYSQNPSAHIYLTTNWYDSRFYSSETWQSLVLNANYETRQMGMELGIPVIDLAAISGFNSKTYYDSSAPAAKYTYDGTHFNQKGSYQMGMTIRKEIIGI